MILTYILKKLFAHSNIVLIVCLCMFALMGWISSGLHLSDDIMNILPLNDKSVRDYADVLLNFKNSNQIVFMVQTNMRDDVLTDAAQSLSDKLKDSRYIEQVRYKWDIDDINTALEKLNTYSHCFFSELNSATLSSALTLESIDKMMAKIKAMLIETPVPYITQMVKKDPLGINHLFLKRLQSLYGVSGSLKIKDGIVFSSDEQTLLFTASTGVSMTDSIKGLELVNEINSAVKTVTDKYNNMVTITWLSGHRFAVYNAGSVKRDITVITVVSLVSITLLCFLVFARKYFFLIALLPALFGNLFAASVSAFLPGISAIVLGMGGALSGIVADYGIIILYKADRMDTPDEAMLTGIVKDVTRPFLLCFVTTMIAFSVLLFSDIPGYVQLGRFSMLCLTASFVFVLTVLPVIIVKIKSEGSHPLVPFTPVAEMFRRLAGRYAGLFRLMSVVLTLVALPGLQSLRLDGEIAKLNMASSETQRDFNLLRQTFPSLMNASYIAVRERNQNDLFSKNEQTDRWLSEHSGEQGIDGYTSVAWLLPSDNTLMANTKNWINFWTQQRKEELTENLKTVCAKYGMRPEFFVDYVKKLPGDNHNCNLDALYDQPFFKQLLVQSLFKNERGEGILLTKFWSSNAKIPESFDTMLKKNLPFAFTVDGKSFTNKMVNLMFSEFIKLGTASMVLLLLIVFIFTRSIKATGVFILPLLQAFIFTFGVMGFAGLPFDLMATLVVIFMFGLVIDYSVVLGWSSEQDSSDKFDRTFGSVALSVLTTVFGFGSLILAKHPALHSIGVTAVLGLGSGFMFVLLNIGGKHKTKP
ncbi:MAG: hypothetical protein H7844_11330 [Nitrospirae bacterium YQR-1]